VMKMLEERFVERFVERFAEQIIKKELSSH
jgi:hypothetical protein